MEESGEVGHRPSGIRTHEGVNQRPVHMELNVGADRRPDQGDMSDMSTEEGDCSITGMSADDVIEMLEN